MAVGWMESKGWDESDGMELDSMFVIGVIYAWDGWNLRGGMNRMEWN